MHQPEAGVALNPATPVGTLEEVLDQVELVLVMSVNPGFGGQTFLPLAYDKIRALARLRSERGLKFRIEVDGGVGSENVAELAEAGTDWLVAGSSVFRTPDAGQAVKDMQKRIADGVSVRV